MSYILTIHNESLIKLLFESLGEKKEKKQFKQFIYKYDDSIGILNQNDNTYNSFKLNDLETNTEYVFEKITKEHFHNPPVCIDDLYYENVKLYEDFKIIGDKDRIIIQFMFNHKDYSNFVNIIRTNYKLLFDKLDLSFLNSYFETYCDTSIDSIKYKSRIESIATDKHLTPKYFDHKYKDPKNSKYQTKNTEKYEPKHIVKTIITTGTKPVHNSYKKYEKRFDSKISFVPRVDSK
jgi:hypothetical protein